MSSPSPSSSTSPLQQLLLWKSTQPPEGSAEESLYNSTLLASSLKASTRRQYSVPVRYYKLLTTFPITLTRLQTFMRALRDLGYPGPTIRKYISAISSENAILGHPPLTATDKELLRRSLRGIDRTSLQAQPPRQAPRISDDAITALLSLQTVTGSERSALRGIALSSIGFVARLSEVISLRAEDLSYSPASTSRECILRVRFRDTKTKLWISKECSCDATQPINCKAPFCVTHFLLRAFEQVHGVGYLFPGFSSSSFMTKLKHLVSHEFPALSDVWQVSSWSYHSFRVTGACRLKALGYQDSDIQFAGHWVSDAWKRYVSSHQSLASKDQAQVILHR